MRSFIHKTRKETLKSHLAELQLPKTERIRNLFQTPNLELFYQINSQEVTQ